MENSHQGQFTLPYCGILTNSLFLEMLVQSLRITPYCEGAKIFISGGVTKEVRDERKTLKNDI